MKKIATLLSLLLLVWSSLASADETAMTQALHKLGVTQIEIKESPIAGLHTVLTDKGVLYITTDGKYLLQGQLYDVTGKEPLNVTGKILKQKMDSMTEQMIIYPAAKEKYVVTVFTDITCGYCQKLHSEMKSYNDEGITVRYLAFPRQGSDSDVAKTMQSIWCSADRKTAFDKSMKGEDIPAATCNVDIKKHFELGVQFEITGTPAVILPDGSLVPGYQSAKEMLETLREYDPTVKTPPTTKK